MMDAETLLRSLDESGSCERRAGGYWVTVPNLDVRGMAKTMRSNEIRLVTVTARPDPNEGYQLIYHWDADGGVLNIATTVSSGNVPTISDILPAADWVEREIRDYYGLEFDGRASTPTLMLRPDDEPGLFARTATLGTDKDPAETARIAGTTEELDGTPVSELAQGGAAR